MQEIQSSKQCKVIAMIGLIQPFIYYALWAIFHIGGIH